MAIQYHRNWEDTDDELTISKTFQKIDPLGPELWNANGELVRPPTVFRNFISREPAARFPPEKGRYHLYVSYACPWAHRTLIARKVKGLEDIISVTSVHYHMSLTDSWRFAREDEEVEWPELTTPDPLHKGFYGTKALYYHADPDYKARFSVPILWDKKLDTIVNNESSEIIRMFYTEFDDLLPPEKRIVDLYPEALRAQIDETNTETYDNVNNGVYKCGLAKTQEAYHSAVTNLFTSLDHIEAHLKSSQTDGPYYFGSQITEADIRLYVTIVRFDTVYVSLFKTNRGMIRHDYPHIDRWARNLYWNVPAFRETTSFEHIKGHYFRSLTMLNPEGIVPEGPVPHILPVD